MALLQQNVVTIGAGTGQANLLRELKRHFMYLTAIVGVTDNGGHSGLLRQELDIPQVGDGRQVLTALASNTEVAARFDYRFISANGGQLHGVSIGNLVLASLCQKEGDIGQAFRVAARELGCTSPVFPATVANTNIPANSSGEHTY